MIRAPKLLSASRRLFVIQTRVDASLIIFALAMGAISRGQHYLTDFPGWGGWLLLLACTGSVVLAGAKIFDCLRFERIAQAEAAANPATGSTTDGGGRA